MTSLRTIERGTDYAMADFERGHPEAFDTRIVDHESLRKFMNEMRIDLGDFRSAYTPEKLATEPKAAQHRLDEFDYHRLDYLKRVPDDALRQQIAEVVFGTPEAVVRQKEVTRLKKLEPTREVEAEIHKLSRAFAEREILILKTVIGMRDYPKIAAEFWDSLQQAHDVSDYDLYWIERRGVLRAAAGAMLLHDANFDVRYTNAEEDADWRVDMLAMVSDAQAAPEHRVELRNTALLVQFKDSPTHKPEAIFSPNFELHSDMDPEVRAFIRSASKFRDAYSAVGLKSHPLFMGIPLSYRSSDGRQHEFVDANTGEPRELLRRRFSEEMSGALTPLTEKGLRIRV